MKQRNIRPPRRKIPEKAEHFQSKSRPKPSSRAALIFCALAGLLTTVTGLTAILSLFASGLIFLALFTTVKAFPQRGHPAARRARDTYCNSNFCASNAPERLRRALE